MTEGIAAPKGTVFAPSPLELGLVPALTAGLLGPVGEIIGPLPVPPTAPPVIMIGVGCPSAPVVVEVTTEEPELSPSPSESVGDEEGDASGGG